MDKQMTLVRVYLSEADQGRKHNLLDEIMQLLHDKHRVHGVTVFRGIAGFGAKGSVRAADLLRLTQRLPLVVEFFDEPAAVEEALRALDEILPAGHVISWPVSCRVNDN
jgi:PII-like signaling protein